MSPFIWKLALSLLTTLWLVPQNSCERCKVQVVHGSLSRTNGYRSSRKGFESEMTVTRKGQVTIPTELRKKYGIREGMKVDITDAPTGLLLKPIPHMNDWAGSDVGKYRHEELIKELYRLARKGN